jgi:hypothetical protein
MTLDEKKIGKLDDLEIAYRIKLSDGYYNLEKNITLSLLSENRKIFNEMIVQVQLADSMEQILSTITISDKNGILYDLSLADFKSIMFQYGSYYQSLWKTYVTYKNTINNITDENMLSNLIITFE